MVAGIRGNRLSGEAADAVIQQALEFLQKAADTYETSIAPGEVGRHGTSRATDAPPVREDPTALLYGRIQSGKTAAMITTTALAMDNGFRIVIVLTANNVTLVRQTANRFRALGGPIVLSAFKGADEYEWVGRLDELREDVPTDGLVIVSAKDATHLPAVIRLLQELNAASYPALIFDDEADAATPDTTLAARTSGRSNAPPFASTIHRRVVQNTAPGEAGESIREALPHSVYVQVTATPYVLLLQRPDSPLRPSFTHLLVPGEGYRGGEHFFGDFDPAADRPERPVVLVSDTEAQTLLAARRGNPPIGVAQSIAFFLLAGAAHAVLRRGRRFPERGYKHLSHTSVRMDHHDQLVALVQRHLHTLRVLLRDPLTDATRAEFAEAYAELRRSEDDIRREWHRMPALDELLTIVADNFRQSEVIKVNATTGEPEYGPAYNFVVGGNILGRGVTIEDLLVTYYLREALTSQMDTVWQHGRMFGYRTELMPFSRVYLPRRLANRFQEIHESEVILREMADEISRGRPVPISLVSGARATRPNALEADSIRLYRPGTQIFPRYIVSDRAKVGNSNVEIRRILLEAGVPLNEAKRELRFRVAPIERLVQLATLVPVRDDDDGRWDTDAVAAILDALGSEYQGEGALYVRAFEREDDRRLQTGVLSGPEVNLARNQGKPVLALVYRGDHNHPDYWYPTLYMPANARTQIFNANP
jgi:hypothetical protein